MSSLLGRPHSQTTGNCTRLQLSVAVTPRALTYIAVTLDKHAEKAELEGLSTLDECPWTR